MTNVFHETTRPSPDLSAIDTLERKRAATMQPRGHALNLRTINAILYVLKTGMPWNDLPEEYGDDVTAWRRLRDWEELGVWKRIMDAPSPRSTRWTLSTWTRSRWTATRYPPKRGSSCWL